MSGCRPPGVLSHIVSPRVGVIVATVAFMLASAVALAAPAAAHAWLARVTGIDGCVSATGYSGPPAPRANACRMAGAIGSSVRVIVTADGRNLYAVSGVSAESSTAPSLSVFTRRAEGTLRLLDRPIGCAALGDLSGSCTGAVSVDSIVATPDGRQIYGWTRAASSARRGGIATFLRDPRTGVLRERVPSLAVCLSGQPGIATQSVVPCTGKAPEWRAAIRALAVAPNGTRVYAAIAGDMVIAIERDRATGALTLAPGTTCPDPDTTASWTGHCVPAFSSSLLAVGGRVFAGGPEGVVVLQAGRGARALARERTADACALRAGSASPGWPCTRVRASAFGADTLISDPARRYVYAVTGKTLTALPATGRMRLAGCWTVSRSDSCRRLPRDLESLSTAGVLHDGRTLVVTGEEELSRELECARAGGSGMGRAAAFDDECFENVTTAPRLYVFSRDPRTGALGSAAQRMVISAESLAESPDGRTLYAAWESGIQLLRER